MAELALLGGTPVCDPADWPAWPVWDGCEAAALQDVLESGSWQSGPRVAAFEAAFASYQGARHAVAMTNGTATLEQALRALGAGPGDEIIVPNYTFAATALAVLTVGATPVFVDVDPERLNLDAGAARAALTLRTKGMIPVHVGGHPVDFDALLPLARHHGLFLLEDAAHAHGSAWCGRPVGALGELGSFSFQTGKGMTSGDGGCLLSNSDELAARSRSLRSFGRDEHGRHVQLGTNTRMTEFQAAILACQLQRLDAQIERRRAGLARLASRLAELPGVRLAAPDSRATRLSHYISLLHIAPGSFGGVSKDSLVAALAAEGVPLEPGYGPLTRQPVFAEALAARRARALPCPVSENATDLSVLWLSFRLLLAPPEQLDRVAEALHKIHDAQDALADWQRRTGRPQASSRGTI